MASDKKIINALDKYERIHTKDREINTEKEMRQTEVVNLLREKMKNENFRSVRAFSLSLGFKSYRYFSQIMKLKRPIPESLIQTLRKNISV